MIAKVVFCMCLLSVLQNMGVRSTISDRIVDTNKGYPCTSLEVSPSKSQGKVDFNLSIEKYILNAPCFFRG